MGATNRPRRSVSVRMVFNDVFAVAGKHFDPAISAGWCELFVECFIETDSLRMAAARFAVERGGRLQPLTDVRWPVPLLRIVLPLPPRGRPMVAFSRLATSLFQSLLSVAD